MIRAPRRAVVAGALAALLIGLGVGGAGLYVRHMDAELLRSLPSVAAQTPGLVKYARWRAAGPLQAHCAACHGEGLTGEPTRGAPNLVDKDWVYGDGSVSDIEQTILYGIRSGGHRAHDLADMPAFSRIRPYKRYAIVPLSPGEIGDVVQFILALERRPADPASAARGAVIYGGKGQCFDCHTPDASGDTFAGAPNLRDRVWMNGDGSATAIFDIIAYGRSGACPAWARRLPPAVVRAMAVDLHTQSQAGS